MGAEAAGAVTDIQSITLRTPPGPVTTVRGRTGGITRRSRRHLFGGAVSLCLAVILTACSPTAPSSIPATGTPGPSASPRPSPTATVPAGDRLSAALQPLDGGYTFETTVTVGGTPAVHATGRRLGSSSELTVDSGGVSVTYRIIPPKAWLMSESGDWAPATDPGSSADPLAPLLAPTAVTSVAGAAGVDTLEATYPATALGLTGTGSIKVTVAIAGDGSVTVRYETPVGTQTSVSETVFHAAPTQDPIVPPSPLPSGG